MDIRQLWIQQQNESRQSIPVCCSDKVRVWANIYTHRTIASSPSKLFFIDFSENLMESPPVFCTFLYKFPEDALFTRLKRKSVKFCVE